FPARGNCPPVATPSSAPHFTAPMAVWNSATSTARSTILSSSDSQEQIANYLHHRRKTGVGAPPSNGRGNFLKTISSTTTSNASATSLPSSTESMEELENENRRAPAQNSFDDGRHRRRRLELRIGTGTRSRRTKRQNYPRHDGRPAFARPTPRSQSD